MTGHPNLHEWQDLCANTRVCGLMPVTFEARGYSLVARIEVPDVCTGELLGINFAVGIPDSPPHPRVLREVALQAYRHELDEQFWSRKGRPFLPDHEHG